MKKYLNIITSDFPTYEFNNEIIIIIINNVVCTNLNNINI